MKGLEHILIGDCWHGEAEGELTRSGVSYVSRVGAYLAFSWF